MLVLVEKLKMLWILYKNAGLVMMTCHVTALGYTMPFRLLCLDWESIGILTLDALCTRERHWGSSPTQC
jgi:hypothetical protein